MNLTNSLQLTYIPSLYWNHPLSGFKTESDNKDLTKETSFFLVWIPLNDSEKDLTEEIKKTFPKIPAEKLVTCKIRLAFPLGMLEPRSIQEDYFGVIEVLGKIIPIPPLIRLLYQLEIVKSPERVLRYSDSIKTWAFLTKLIFELLNRGAFIPILELSSEKQDKQPWPGRSHQKQLPLFLRRE